MARQNRIAYILFGLLVVVAAIFASQILNGEPALDGEGCPVHRNYPTQAAVLLDPSDPLNTPQSFVARRIVGAVDRNAPAMTEVKTFSVAQAGRQDTIPHHRMCKPVHFDSIPPIRRWTVNRRMMEEAYDKYQETFRQSLSGVLQQPGDTVSPILEAIQTSVLSAFPPRDAETPRWLVVVSDMAQNSDCWTVYGNPANTSFLDLSRRPCFRSLRVNLSNVRVTIYQLARRGRTGRIQRRNLRQFWDDYFLDMGADTPNWVDVEG